MPRVAADFSVRDGRVEATVRPIPANGYPQPAALFLFDHQTLNVREIPVDLPSDLAEYDAIRTIVIDAFAGRQVVAQAKAPDGYELETRNYRGTGLVGDLFGMGRYDQTVALVNKRSLRDGVEEPVEERSGAETAASMCAGNHCQHSSSSQ